MTARRFEAEAALAGLRSGPCGWETRLRQLDGHRNGLLGLDVHDLPGSWKTTEGTWELTGHMSACHVLRFPHGDGAGACGAKR